MIYPMEEFGVSHASCELSEEVLEELEPLFRKIDASVERRQIRVLQALQKAGLQEASLSGSSGYGYDDAGRTALELAFADYFRSESAYVRMQFSSGTQVLTACLRGLLRPGDELLIASSMPYDTIRPSIGIGEGESPTPAHRGSLRDFQISHRIVELKDGRLDIPAILEAVSPATRLVYIQKSRGYERRRCLLNREIGEVVKAVKARYPQLLIMVDNCYGEMTEEEEPTAYGVDICAGSLIKNLGAGIADSGAYICGKKDLIEEIASMVTAPGLGTHIGPSLNQTRNLLRGFYFAPQVTAAALKSAMHASSLFARAGYATFPTPLDERGDIVQLICCGSREKLIAFCQAIQAASAVDSIFAPVPGAMPGYDCDIIMASGSFVQGSSIELSCDGPLRPPYDAYLQGGLSFAHARYAQLCALDKLRMMETAREARHS